MIGIKAAPFRDAGEAPRRSTSSLGPTGGNTPTNRSSRRTPLCVLAVVLTAALQRAMSPDFASDILLTVCQPARKADQLPASNIDQGRPLVLGRS